MKCEGIKQEHNFPILVNTPFLIFLAILVSGCVPAALQLPHYIKMIAVPNNLLSAW
jgi:hypothetical protein